MSAKSFKSRTCFKLRDFYFFLPSPLLKEDLYYSIDGTLLVRINGDDTQYLHGKKLVDTLRDYLLGGKIGRKGKKSQISFSFLRRKENKIKKI